MANKYTPLKSHKKEKSKLKPPFSQFNMNMLDWERDFLPEHLWVELLAEEYKDKQWYRMYNDFLDKLEEEIPDDKICLFGFITDFGFVPSESREKFISKNKDFIYYTFYVPIGCALTLYPENPANWLLLEEWKNAERIDFERELEKLSRSVRRLMKSKDLYAGHIRGIPLNRLFKHERLFISKEISVVNLIPKYPADCNEDEKYRVQSFARNTMNMEYMRDERYKSKEWSKYFWRHNYDLIPCVPSETSFPPKGKISQNEMGSVLKNIEYNCDTVSKFLDILAIQYKYDLYDPTKDEILLGLFSRLTRLYIIFLTDPSLWARDLTGIFLRCIVDTAITFAYLIKNGSAEDFENFKNYGEGKEKLLMLHLQDTYKESKSLEDAGVDEIAEELGGGINPELIEIDLSGWTKKNSRKLSIESGFEDYYKLVYDPASADVHGTWTSIKKSNLVHCQMALHRFHKMPSFVEPPLFIQNVNLAQKIYERCLNIGQEHLKFPNLEEPLKEIWKVINSSNPKS